MAGYRIGIAALAILTCLGWNPTHAFDLGGRWTHTQTDGHGIERGDAITLLWSIVPDGESYDRSANSDLVGFMDDQWSVAPIDRTPDLTNRAWFDLFQQAYDQYAYVSGLTLTYVAEQRPGGSISGNFGDLRIGGEPFDPNGPVLADNTYPNGGDMRIDTSETPFYHPGNVQGVINLVSHESGHGVGLGHTIIQGAEAVMESALQSHFFGLQFDDIYAFNRLYGDPLEKNGGNDSAATATQLGSYNQHTTVSLGTDAGDALVEQFDDDWLGIDGTSDQDWFKFSVSKPGVAQIKITPQGPAYQTSNQGRFLAAEQSDLSLEIYASDLTPLSASNTTGLGGSESLNQWLDQPGDYYVRVSGEEDLNQFYQLDVTASVSGLVLNVDRRTGQATLTSIDDQAIDMTGYVINSANGELNPASNRWQSLHDQNPSVWDEVAESTTDLAELAATGMLHLEPGESAQLGTPYQPIVTEPFGVHHQDGDLTFSYTTTENGGTLEEGGVLFTGDPFYNTLVLSVDPDTGLATLTNESFTTVQLIGYTISSATGDLLTDSWMSLTDQEIEAWEEAEVSATNLSELNPTAGSVLESFDVLELGKIFDPTGEQNLDFNFAISSSQLVFDGVVVFEAMGLQGDYNSDGTVDAADYAVWRNSLGDNGAGLAADGNRDGTVNSLDYDLWRMNYGESLTPTASTSQAALAPEPASLVLLLAAFAACGRFRQRY